MFLWCYLYIERWLREHYCPAREVYSRTSWRDLCRAEKPTASSREWIPTSLQHLFFKLTCLAIWHPNGWSLQIRKPLISHCCLFSSMATYLLLFCSCISSHNPAKKNQPPSWATCSEEIRLFNPQTQKDFYPECSMLTLLLKPSCVSFIHVFPKRLQSTQLVRLPPVQGSRIALSQNWMTFGLHANWKIWPSQNGPRTPRSRDSGYHLSCWKG